ncbi:hypothetical protein BO70DRAFT_363336 [Aspergillus heteromorphus CBS 117.55]|uniref:Glycoside hydrolase 131 catalytic N-terminal domain-containing protein n=1 Tax=Aspergillus heteromorphus CBS 117.55 TaxID=1448321 RepID=A0A317VSU8_9EURO|nr:uncharacterized protein BO70DRAFT_363336 [Aspergillus heteromorphus CBS 117.55]PWY77406.1 hypothetical protein BO70DRAFT_363336 [Aspergillus heteromorphus CBS 117.55]
MKSSLSLLALPASALAGTVRWSGIFNSSATVAELDEWSWSNQIEPWQWYIHGTANTSEYLGLSSSFKNPAASDAQGLRTTIDGTSFWEGQTMERTELIPQTTADLGSGHLYYHFSLSTKTTNPPNASFEHQIAFFESHFTEIQYGLVDGASGTSDNTLRWNAAGDTQWSVQLEAGNWYNFAYDIDFSAKTVGLWASNGSEALTEVVSPVSASVSSNSEDWHVGVLRLPGSGANDAAAEDWFWSGVYVEEGELTTSIGDGSSSSENETTTAAAAAATTSAAAVETTAAATTTSEAAAVETTTAAAAAAAAETTTSAVLPTQIAVSASTAAAEAATTTSSVSSATQAATSAVIAVGSSVPAESASSSASSSEILPAPSTAAQALAEMGSVLKALLSKSGGAHARDFAVRR